MDIVSYAIGYSKGVSDAPTPTPDPDTPEKYNLTEINGKFYIQGDEVKIRRNDVYTANIKGSDLYYHGASVITANGNNDTAYKYTKVSARYSGDSFTVDFDEHGDILKFDDIECVLINNVLYSTNKTEYKTVDSYESRSNITFEDYADNFSSIYLTSGWHGLLVDNNFSLDDSSAYMNIDDDNKCYHGSTINYDSIIDYPTYSIYKPVLVADSSTGLLAFDSEGYPIYTNKFEDDDGNAYYDPYFFKYNRHTYMWFNTINDPSVRSKLVFADFDDPIDYSALGLITVSNVPMDYGHVESTGFIREIDISDVDANGFSPSRPFILPVINNNTGRDKYINGALLMPYMTNDNGVYRFNKLYELLESSDGIPEMINGKFVVTNRRYLAYVNGLLMDIYNPPSPDDYFEHGSEHVEYFWEPQYPDVYIGNDKIVFKKSFKYLDSYDSTRYIITDTLTHRTYSSIGNLFYALNIQDGSISVPKYGVEDSANSDYFYLDGVLFYMREDFS